jgi:hypothetical protein
VGAAVVAVLASTTAPARASEGAPFALSYEVWLDGAYAVAPVVVDPLGSLRLRLRLALLPHLAVAFEGGPGLACLEACGVGAEWVIQAPVSLDVDYVVGAPERAGFEVGAGYGVAPSFPLGGGSVRWAQGPFLAVRARTAEGGGPRLLAGLAAQVDFVQASPFERSTALVVGPMIGVGF